MKPAKTQRCASCGLDVAAWMRVRGDKTYCSDFCMKSATTDGAAMAVESARQRVVAKVRRGARA
jgi:hypothetical protein